VISTKEIMNAYYPSFTPDDPASQLRQEYEAQEALYRLQPPLVQRFLETQVSGVAEALLQKLPQVRFTLPPQVSCGPEGKLLALPAEEREQLAGGLLDRLTKTDLRLVLRQRLLELEGAPDSALSTAARLLRHALALHLIYHLLPSGRSVVYAARPGEEIPTDPAGDELAPDSAITAQTDAIAEEGGEEGGRGELLVPYVPAARKFYLPQWVAFDDQGRLLVNNANEAEAHVASMQRFVGVLHLAVGLAPYMVADEEYQRKRYGMLGQLVNQGRSLASYEVEEIIRTIKRRAAAKDLNRGLSLSLPYFDDQELEMKLHEFVVIPAGRIMFAPVFMVRAAREEEAKVAQDTRLSPSSRKYLLAELKKLEQAFLQKTEH
jgi:hypothetical protein